MLYRFFLTALAVYLFVFVVFTRLVGLNRPAVAATPHHSTSHTQKVTRVLARHRKTQTALALRRAKLRTHHLAVHHRWDRTVNSKPTRGTFRRFYRMTATAYAPINTRMEGGRWTKTQRDGRAVHGVAVDPHLIPLGSRLWIPGYGHAVADDTGGSIRGHHIDLRMQHYPNVHQWGKRPVRVYVLDEPEG